VIGDDAEDFDAKEVEAGELDAAGETLPFRELTGALRVSLGRLIASTQESTTSAARLRLFFPGVESPISVLVDLEAASLNIVCSDFRSANSWVIKNIL
jgi:hypothetical protein